MSLFKKALYGKSSYSEGTWDIRGTKPGEEVSFIKYLVYCDESSVWYRMKPNGFSFGSTGFASIKLEETSADYEHAQQGFGNLGNTTFLDYPLIYSHTTKNPSTVEYSMQQPTKLYQEVLNNG